MTAAYRCRPYAGTNATPRTAARTPLLGRLRGHTRAEVDAAELADTSEGFAPADIRQAVRAVPSTIPGGHFSTLSSNERQAPPSSRSTTLDTNDLVSLAIRNRWPASVGSPLLVSANPTAIRASWPQIRTYAIAPGKPSKTICSHASRTPSDVGTGRACSSATTNTNSATAVAHIPRHVSRPIPLAGEQRWGYPAGLRGQRLWA